MSGRQSPDAIKEFSEDSPQSCRIETEGGTVYWISEPDQEGVRWVIREHLRSSDTNTMVMQRLSSSQAKLDLGDKFRATLGGEVVVGLPFVLEVKGIDTRILTEVVVTIEVGNVPSLVFG